MDDARLLAAVDDYCRALHTTDVEVLDRVFHPAASLFDAATVALRIRIFAQVFVDHLQLVRDGDTFRVVAKTWHLEGVVD